MHFCLTARPLLPLPGQERFNLRRERRVELERLARALLRHRRVSSPHQEERVLIPHLRVVRRDRKTLVVEARRRLRPA